MYITRWKAVLVGVVALAVIVPAAAFAATSVFDDVADDSVYVNDINWLAASGVTKGCNPPANTRFCPGSNVTREQMAAFMHRLSVNRVVDAGTLQGFTAAQLGGGTQSVAAGAGARNGSSDDPTILREDSITQLASLGVRIPASGGVIDMTGTVMFDTFEPDSSSFVSAWMTWDLSCTSTANSLAGAGADVSNVWYANIPLNAAVSPSAGNHTIRLCAVANHEVTTDVTWVVAARISTVWVPTSMGGMMSLTAADSGETGADYMAKTRAMRDAWVAENGS